MFRNSQLPIELKSGNVEKDRIGRLNPHPSRGSHSANYRHSRRVLITFD